MARRKINKPTKKKLLTLDDLYSFYLEQNKTCRFSSEESGYQLSVQVPAYFEVSDEEDSDNYHDLEKPDVSNTKYYACVVDKNRAGAKPKLAFRLNLDYNRWEEVGYLRLKQQ